MNNTFFFFFLEKRFLVYIFNTSPRKYCKYAVTNNPVNVTGTNPNTIPDKSGSTILN